MRVAHIIESFSSDSVATVEMLLRDSARQKLAHVVIACGADDPQARKKLEALGARTHLVARVSRAHGALAEPLAALFTEEHIGVVHTHDVGPLVHAEPAARKCGLPIVHTEYSWEQYASGPMRLVGRVMHQLALVIAASPEVAAYHARAFGRRCPVVGQGLPVVGPVNQLDRKQARLALGCLPNAFVVGAALVEADRGEISTLLNAHKKLIHREPEAQLLVLATEAQRALLHEARAACGLTESNVRIIDERHKDVLLAGIDALALASGHEHIPAIVLDAMTRELPIVAPPIGALCDALRDGAGLLVTPRVPVALATALAGIWASDEVRRGMSARARVRFASRFSPLAMAGAYARAYHHVHGKAAEQESAGMAARSVA